MNRHRVAITGIGAITPIGTGVEPLWAGVRRGESAVRRISRFDPSAFPSQIAAEVERVLDDHPLAGVLTSMPGVGVRTAARILVEVGDASSFPTAGHLAAYAGLAPVTRRSGSSIKGEHPARGGNKRLKNALFLSAFAALSDP